MSTEVERAMEIYDEARQAEEQKQFDAAEKYYVKSANLFQQIGGTHFINAAHALNALSSLREGRGDYNGALCSAKHSAGIMEIQAIDFSSRHADEIRLQTWGLIGNLYRRMARYIEAEQTLKRAFEYARDKFGDEDEETAAACDRLGILYKDNGEFDKAEKLHRDALADIRSEFEKEEPYSPKAWEINRRVK